MEYKKVQRWLIEELPGMPFPVELSAVSRKPLNWQQSARLILKPSLGG